MASQYKIPKGPSNSTGMGATPGTQQTALQNVGGLNLNPNMPQGPQLARQGRSSFQQGLMTPSPSPQAAPRPAAPRPAAPRPGMTGMPRQTPAAPERVVTRGMPMDPGRGYNVFSGLGADEISSMNSSMGLSNMTALPPLATPMPALQQQTPTPASLGMRMTPEVTQLRRGRPMEQQLTSGSSLEGLEPEAENEFVSTEWNPYTGSYVTTIKNPDGSTTVTDQTTGKQGTANVPEEEEEADKLASTWDDITGEAIGIDPEQKQQMMDTLDDEYARKLQFALAGLDRQAAMMGTFGSGGHMMQMNAAVAQVLADMADEYSKVEAMDIEQTELDMEQMIANKLKFLGFEQSLSESDLNIASKFSSDFILPLNEFIEDSNLSGDIKAALMGATGSFAAEAAGKLLSNGASPGDIATGFAYVDKAMKLMIQVGNEEKTLAEAEKALKAMIPPWGEGQDWQREFILDIFDNTLAPALYSYSAKVEEMQALVIAMHAQAAKMNKATMQIGSF